MKIYGFNKTTLLDYPGHLAASLFLGGCNFRCPFCHNKNLVLNSEKEPYILEDEVLSYLEKRKNILEGVCISGGEPTLNIELESFIRKIKKLGLLVKLDTNGYLPDVLSSLYLDGLIDYVAMDVKSSKENYSRVAGVSLADLSRIERSVEFIKTKVKEYEFRTTVVKELHTASDFKSIGDWLEGASQYYLQSYRETENVISPIFTSYSKHELDEFCLTLQKYIKKVEIRG